MDPTVTIKDKAKIIEILFKHGVVSVKDQVELHPYLPNLNKKNAGTVATYRVTSSGKNIIFLTVGLNLDDLYTRTLEFTRENSDIACLPLFYLKEAGIDYLGLEYFGIGNLDECFEKQLISSDQLSEAVTTIKQYLARSAKASTFEAMTEEVRSIENQIAQIDVLSPYDRDFIQTKLFPILYKELKTSKTDDVKTYWTNGDFITRNIILGDSKTVKLIDYEFSHRTHFPDLDYFRLKTFSQDKASYHGHELTKFITLLGWLQHIATLYRSNLGAQFALEYTHISSNLIRAL